MPGLGEARKFISPEDREALVNSSQEVRENRDDPEKLKEAEENKSVTRERISEKMWQEIYRRGSVFGQELLSEYQRAGDLPWSDVREMLSAGLVPPELEGKYPEVAKHIEGMSSIQKIIFTKTIMYAEQDHLDAEAVVKRIEDQMGQESLTGTPEEVGRALFIACNTKGKAKLAPPVGTVVYHKRGPFIELEMSDDRDIDALYDGEYSGSRNGFFSTNENFYVRGGKLPRHIGNSRLVAFKKDSRGTLEHEEGHYLHRLSERARSFVDGTELKRQSVVEKRLKDLERLYHWPWNVGKRDEITQLYKDALSDLQAICFDRAKSEIAAAYYAGDYQCGNSLYVASKHGTESSYNVYGAIFGKRLGKVAAPLRALVNVKREEYNDVVLEQSAALSLLATSLRMMGLEPQYRDKINALIADCPITGISGGIKKAFGAEFAVAKKYNDLQFSVDMSYRRVKNIGEDYPSERSMVQKADSLVAEFIDIIEERVAKPVRGGSDLPAIFNVAQPKLEEIEREMKKLQARV